MQVGGADHLAALVSELHLPSQDVARSRASASDRCHTGSHEASEKRVGLSRRRGVGPSGAVRGGPLRCTGARRAREPRLDTLPGGQSASGWAGRGPADARRPRGRSRSQSRAPLVALGRAGRGRRRMSYCGWFPMRRGEILAWVERHRDGLPTTLAELARLPMPFRSAVVSAVEPERRIRFWTEHLQSFLGPRSSLTTEQQAFVAATIPDLPHLLSAPAPNAVMSAWEARASRHFSREEASRLFAMIGPPEPPEGLPLPPDAHL